MKNGLLVACVLILQYSAFSQGSFVFNPGTGAGGSTYSTGTGTAPPGVTGTATDIRARAFSGSGYFTSGGPGLDTSFALRLGNGVDPRAASSAQIELVPEPSAIALTTLGAALLFLRRAVKGKRAGT